PDLRAPTWALIELGLAGLLARFWKVRGHIREGWAWGEELLALEAGHAGVAKGAPPPGGGAGRPQWERAGPGGGNLLSTPRGRAAHRRTADDGAGSLLTGLPGPTAR